MEWTRGRTIGRGSSATVSLATSSTSGDVFAVKSAELSRSSFLQREQQILSSLNSPFIVRYNGCDITMEDGKLLYNLLIDYAPGGSLSDAIRRNGGGLYEPTIVNYTRQILRGLEHLHSAGIVHCDIKASNILIGNEGAQIGDLGCAKRLESDAGAAPISGTPAFMAPEVARGEQQGLPSDIWSLGCTIIEMASGRPPWQQNGSEPVSVLYRIAYSEELPELPCFLSEEAKNFLWKCLRRNPEERWTVSQLVGHPFLAESNIELGNKVVEESSWSPTSVLDRGVWNSVEESESVSAVDEDSARERMEQLAELAAGPNWDRDRDWDWDCEWMSVRRYECEIKAQEKSSLSNSDVFVGRMDEISGTNINLELENEIEGDKLLLHH